MVRAAQRKKPERAWLAQLLLFLRIDVRITYVVCLRKRNVKQSYYREAQRIALAFVTTRLLSQARR